MGFLRQICREKKEEGIIVRQPQVVIIGAGIVGLSTAYSLLTQGAGHVTILEQEVVDHPRGTSHGISRLLRFEYGPDIFYSRMVHMSLSRWKRLEQVSQRTLYTRTGLLVLGNDHVVFVVGQPPLAAHKRRLCDVPCGEGRHLVGAEDNRTDDRIKLGRADGLGQRGAVRRVARSFHGIDRNFKQRMDETNWLGPLPAGCLLVAFGEVGSADAAQARFVRMAGRPPHLGRNVVAALAERLNSCRKQQGLGDGHHLWSEAFLARLIPERCKVRRNDHAGDDLRFRASKRGDL